MAQQTSSAAAARRNRRPIEQDGVANSTLSTNISKASAAKGVSHSKHQFKAGRTTNANSNHQRRRSFTIVRRIVLVVCFVLIYWTVYHHLDKIERQYDVEYSQGKSTAPPESGAKQSPTTTTSSSYNKNTQSKSLAEYLPTENLANPSTVDTPSLKEARKGREQLVSILEDAGIDRLDAKDVLRLPLWSSVTNLYYNNKGANSKDGPIILGLEGCAKFRKALPPNKRFLGVAGNFNSGTTAFGKALQKNCIMDDHPSDKNFVIRKRKAIFASNVNGMLSMVPWAKHKFADFRHNYTIHPPYAIDHDAVLPIVLVRDPFYWMQSMCKEGYGVRWDHDSSKHCPNLIPNEFDQRRFPKLASKDKVQVWMGANPKKGPTWPSLIHYWNAWYESYFKNNDIPRLVIRFEDTLFYPKQVMEQVCHCGGGTLAVNHDYSLDEAKPEHKHDHKNNFVTAMIEYGTNSTRLRNMTKEDIGVAIQHLNPTLMQAFGYSYPSNTKDD
eukprot:CAMPEP_0116079666 /NCGR_PEP_ID=MMETSP0327-20121206/1265_1 /TAXON_ID=44447 /ORGANISM="Pseudo-nitzschia delicatissima, Strain B596" /LENGTH=496 /DNA_ID=CAMNT_0003570309 /DNA_START=97 /DNA_END=1587 /DNA_ORIENTATION=+